MVKWLALALRVSIAICGSVISSIAQDRTKLSTNETRLIRCRPAHDRILKVVVVTGDEVLALVRPIQGDEKVIRVEAPIPILR